jgi:hypothetical protein
MSERRKMSCWLRAEKLVAHPVALLMALVASAASPGTCSGRAGSVRIAVASRVQGKRSPMPSSRPPAGVGWICTKG